MNTTTFAGASRSAFDRPDRALWPWWPWLLTALAFPPSGLIAHAVAGPVDSLTSAAVGGAVAGAGVGAAQWAVLRRRYPSLAWIPATAVGMGAGLAVGAALVSYRIDRPSLAVMGAFSGLGIGLAQAATTRRPLRALVWGAGTAALFAVGWTITASAGIDVERQWPVFGLSGCLTVAFLQSFVIRSFVGRSSATTQEVSS
jgi:hypothetical protein